MAGQEPRRCKPAPALRLTSRKPKRRRARHWGQVCAPSRLREQFAGLEFYDQRHRRTQSSGNVASEWPLKRPRDGREYRAGSPLTGPRWLPGIRVDARSSVRARSVDGRAHADVEGGLKSSRHGFGVTGKPAAGSVTDTYDHMRVIRALPEWAHRGPSFEPLSGQLRTLKYAHNLAKKYPLSAVPVVARNAGLMDVIGVVTTPVGGGAAAGG